MTPEIEQFIERAEYCQRDIRKLATMLPTDDAVIDQWMEETVRLGDIDRFQCFVAAALHAGRKLDARHLEAGVEFCAGQNALGCMAWKMEGDVAKYLMRAVLTERLPIVVEVNTLYVIAAWCVAFRNSEFPPELVPATRRAIRDKNLPWQCSIPLYGVAGMTKDDQLMAMIGDLIKMGNKKVHPGRMKEMTTSHLPICRGPMIDTVPIGAKIVSSDGGPVRREANKVGRNERCPCGSGKKYKQCCIGKDPGEEDESAKEPLQLLRQAMAEAETDRLRPYISQQQLRTATFQETLRWDVQKIPQSLLPEYFVKLAGFGYFAEAVHRLELLPRTGTYTDNWLFCWNVVCFWITRAGHRDLLKRMFNLVPDDFEEDMPLDTRLLLADEDPAKCWKILEECTLEALQTDDTSDLVNFSSYLLNSKAKLLGIFVARSLIPMVDKGEAAKVLASINEVRDKLNLPADEPYEDILDNRLTEQTDTPADTAKLEAAQRSLEAKAREVRELKESLHELNRQIELREKKTATQTPQAQPEKVDERALAELRRKVDGLKSALKQRHNERNDLRRELQKAHEDLEELQSKSATSAPATTEEADEEESLFLPADENAQQPIRLIDFPKKFEETLNGYPRHVGRAAMVMIGRLAAGEPAAFVGMVKLKACPELLRQRIGSDYRLLFRLTENHVQIVDLINRKDLFKRLKTLGSNPWYKLFQ
jgi:hypothetical protein